MTLEPLGTVRDAWPYLVPALLALGLGPLLYRLSRVAPTLLPALDGFVLVSVGGLVMFFLLPEAVHEGGALAVVAALLGLAVPTLVERFGGVAHGRVHAIGLAVALFGLVFHTIVDGVALTGAGNEAHHGAVLALAVVLHRLPVGVAVWWLVRPTHGARAAVLVLALIAGGTLLGVGLGASRVTHLEGAGVGLFQALVAGTLLHVVLHGGGVPAVVGERARRLAQGLGGLIGAGVVLAVPQHGHGDEVSHYGPRLLELALDSAPALLLGYALAGVIVVALPRARLGWLRGGRPWAQAARGMAFGIPIPVCSCGVVPVYQGLIQKGVPATAAMAFLVATPELGIESLLLSLPLLGGELTVARLVAAIVVALGVGWLVGRGVAPQLSEDEPVASSSPGFVGRAKDALRHGLVEVVGDTGAWILLGLAIAAAVEPAALGPWLGGLPWGSDVVAAALLGLPVYVCASGATPLAAALLVAGLSPGAALAFLIAGPATNVTTFGVLSDLHGRKRALAFGFTVVGFAVGLGLLVNVLLPAVSVPAADVVDAGAGPLAWICLFGVGGAFLASFLRLGPRGFLEPVVRVSVRGHDHGEGHGHAHAHDDHHHDHHDGPAHGQGQAPALGFTHAEPSARPTSLVTPGSCGSGCCER